MSGFFLYSDQSDCAAEIIGFTKTVGKEANVITFSKEEAQALKNKGADKIFILEADNNVTENYGKAVAKFLEDEEAELFIVGSTVRGRTLAAQVAGYLDCDMVSDTSSISYDNGKLITERLAYGGALVQKEVFIGFNVVTVPSGLFETLQGQAEIHHVKVTIEPKVKLVERAPIAKKGADLSSADKVVCVGLGMDKEEDMQIAIDLAETLGAEIGCTRGIAEERHWLSEEHYIGISGAKISPQLYIGMGISGQVQHMIGVRDSKIIVAVNNNENAPIFKYCDYGIIGDLYKIIPLLTKALQK